MTLLISRIIYTVIILCILYFMLVKVWTKEVDIWALLQQPSEKIPIVKEEIKTSVFVDPAELDLKTKDWDETRIFSVRNPNSNKTIYSIWLKIKTISGQLNNEEIQILPEQWGSLISETTGIITTNFELLKFLADDIQGAQCIYLVIYKIGPLETKSFKIKRRKAVDNTESPLKVSLTVLSSSNEAAPFASQNDDSARILVHNPEPMLVKGFWFWMKRNEE